MQNHNALLTFQIKDVLIGNSIRFSVYGKSQFFFIVGDFSQSITKIKW